MPEEGVDLSPSHQLLTTEEILRLVGICLAPSICWSLAVQWLCNTYFICCCWQAVLGWYCLRSSVPKTYSWPRSTSLRWLWVSSAWQQAPVTSSL